MKLVMVSRGFLVLVSRALQVKAMQPGVLAHSLPVRTPGWWLLWLGGWVRGAGVQL